MKQQIYLVVVYFCLYCNIASFSVVLLIYLLPTSKKFHGLISMLAQGLIWLWSNYTIQQDVLLQCGDHPLNASDNLLLHNHSREF